MISILCLLAGTGALTIAEYPPTTIVVDLSDFFNQNTELSARHEELDYQHIYPGVARLLNEAAVPIHTPQGDRERELLQAADIPTQAPAGPSTTLRLEFSTPDFVNSIYRIHVSVDRADGSFQALPTLVCGPGCLAEDVKPFLQKHEEKILGLLEPPKPKSPSSSASPAELEQGLQASTPEHATDAKPLKVAKTPPIGPVGISGIVAGGLGLGAFGWGSVAFARKRAADWDNAFTERTRPSFFDRSEAVVWGIGGGLIAAGIIMVIVDQLALKPRRKHRHHSSIAGWSISF